MLVPRPGVFAGEEPAAIGEFAGRPVITIKAAFAGNQVAIRGIAFHHLDLGLNIYHPSHKKRSRSQKLVLTVQIMFSTSLNPARNNFDPFCNFNFPTLLM
ncbi:hypothetical protein SDC9_137756 [bioreactor metagenome]|uniref:Uncharacterized protein n=1 Tax=bioreactor metagenome TaxID=1076179 RepID=A0A645DMG4_9ZZZZ